MGSSRRSTRTATVPSLSTSGSALLIRTTRARHCQLRLTSRTRTPSLPTARRLATMIAISTANQKRLGLPAPFQTQEERDACFKSMDENGDGAISYDEWLNFFLKDIISPVAAL